MISKEAKVEFIRANFPDYEKRDARMDTLFLRQVLGALVRAGLYSRKNGDGYITAITNLVLAAQGKHQKGQRVLTRSRI